MTRLATFIAVLMMVASFASAEEAHQPYKGFSARKIASLSDEDIRQITQGMGWGLALPAELNGYPGPIHILELSNELALSDDQKWRIEAIFKEMRKDAITKGTSLIEAERALDDGFKSGVLDSIALKRLIARSEKARADLRFVHLSRHLTTVELLDAEQVATYMELRGYASDPCASVPEGHDADLWRSHNKCDDD